MVYEIRKYEASWERSDTEGSMMISKKAQFKLTLKSMYHLLMDFIGFVKGTFSVIMGT